ncbi:hypothetical protein RBI94_02245 [Pseudomonas putida]|uniref:hypothetical protein n=1 Tax=Pseudomonas putida TaxID=303 RepID=UPI0007716D85|nr:hypothetical protein [Pseudomonas putida]KWW13549.1 hypothetical protein AS889_18010 [Pseudomonas putida]MDQ2482842.1 hypothetical protein [Pseudomonas putida]
MTQATQTKTIRVQCCFKPEGGKRCQSKALASTVGKTDKSGNKAEFCGNHKTAAQRRAASTKKATKPFPASPVLIWLCEEVQRAGYLGCLDLTKDCDEELAATLAVHKRTLTANLGSGVKGFYATCHSTPVAAGGALHHTNIFTGLAHLNRQAGAFHAIETGVALPISQLRASPAATKATDFDTRIMQIAKYVGEDRLKRVVKALNLKDSLYFTNQRKALSLLDPEDAKQAAMRVEVETGRITSGALKKLVQELTGSHNTFTPVFSRSVAACILIEEIERMAAHYVSLEDVADKLSKCVTHFEDGAFMLAKFSEPSLKTMFDLLQGVDRNDIQEEFADLMTEAKPRAIPMNARCREDVEDADAQAYIIASRKQLLASVAAAFSQPFGAGNSDEIPPF